jgi:hypothetical protein
VSASTNSSSKWRELGLQSALSPKASFCFLNG